MLSLAELQVDIVLDHQTWLSIEQCPYISEPGLITCSGQQSNQIMASGGNQLPKSTGTRAAATSVDPRSVARRLNWLAALRVSSTSSLMPRLWRCVRVEGASGRIDEPVPIMTRSVEMESISLCRSKHHKAYQSEGLLKGMGA